MKKIQYIPLFPTNCFILKAWDGYLLIDTSYSEKYDLFLKKLKKRSIKVSEIKYLLLTHYHDDHAGFAARLIKDSGAKLVVHKNAVPLLEKGISVNPFADKKGRSLNHCVKIANFIHSKFLSRTFSYPPVILKKGDIVIENNNENVLKDIGINGKIIHTPGHTNDSISVILSDGSAIVGDAAMNFLNFCHIKYRPIYAEDYEEVFKSWKELLEEGAKVIYPAHGKPFKAENLMKFMGQIK